MHGKHLRNFVIGLVLSGLGLAVVNIIPFTAGTPIKAADVNANFSALKAAVEALQANGGISNTQLADGAVTASKLAATPAPTTGQVLSFNGTALAWATPASGTAYSAGAGLSLSGTTFSIANSGVVSGMLADGAVNTAKLADGAVTGAKVADASVPSAKLSDGPGIAAQLKTGGSATVLTLGTNTTLQTVTLNAPGPGYIVVEASGDAVMVATGAGSVIATISETSSLDGNYQSGPSTNAAQTLQIPFVIHRVKQVTAAGSSTFNLVVMSNGSLSFASVAGARLVATFIPAAYGAVGTN